MLHPAHVSHARISLLSLLSDFKWHGAAGLYVTWTRLAAWVNEHKAGRVRVEFSTPSRYFKALGRESSSHQGSSSRRSGGGGGPPVLPTFSGDLLPYADNENSFWVGFYASRPRLKLLLRKAEAATLAAHWLYVLSHAVSRPTSAVAPAASASFEELSHCRREVALVQHHDAITGTSRSNVVSDYEKRLRDATSKALRVAAVSAAALLCRGDNGCAAAGTAPVLSHRLERPATSASSSATATSRTTAGAGSGFPLVIFNPLPTARCAPVAVPVTVATAAHLQAAVLDSQGRSLAVGVLTDGSEASGAANTDDAATEEEASHTRRTSTPRSPSVRVASPNARIVFRACAPPLGLVTYFVQPAASDTSASASAAVAASAATVASAASTLDRTSTALHSACTSARLDGSSGLLSEISHGCQGTIEGPKPARTLRAKLSLLSYTTTKSGAYIMRTEKASPTALGPEPSSIVLRRTPVLEEATARSPARHTVVTRVHAAGPRADSAGASAAGATASEDAGGEDVAAVEVDVTVYAPRNREVVLRLQTGFDSALTSFHTHDGLAWRRRSGPLGEEQVCDQPG